MISRRKRPFCRSAHVVATALVVFGTCSANAWAQSSITRDEIIDMAKTGLGHGYKWKGSSWIGFEKRGWCSWTSCSDPDACVCVKYCTKNEPCRDFTPTKTSGCGNYFTVDAAGADCAGYVSTCWGLTHYIAGRYYKEAKPQSANTNFPWYKITPDKLTRGDALTSPSHIVLFDERADPSHYYAYEANGCNLGIIYGKRAYQPKKYVSIRRKKIDDPECEPDTCNDHGTCYNGICECYTGYTGSKCQECEEGFNRAGYPNCIRSDSECIPLGAITCNMTPLQISPQDGSNTVSGYPDKCGVQGQGGEIAFGFNQSTSGRASIRLSGDTNGKSLVLMRDACKADRCVARDRDQQSASESKCDASGGCAGESAVSQLTFDFTKDEVFYVVVESEPGANGTATLHVDCGYDDQPFIGDPCNSNTDCDFTADPCLGMTAKQRINGNCSFSGTVQTGYCYQTAYGGMCTMPCTKSCPDRTSLKAPTLCVVDPNNANAGICVPESHDLNHQCEDIPGTESAWLPRFNNANSTTSNTKKSCYPGAPKEEIECTGSFEGRVVDYLTEMPIEQAEVSVTGENTGFEFMGTTLITDSGGFYSLDNVPCSRYTLEFRKNGYVAEQAVIEVAEDSLAPVTRLRLLAPGDCPESNRLDGFVFDSLSPSGNRDPIEGATIEIWPGLSNEVGGNSNLEQAQSEPAGSSTRTQSGPDGRFEFAGLTAGNYSMKVTADGYLKTLVSVVVCEIDDAVQTDTISEIPDIEVALTPAKWKEDTPFRIVLNWNQPADLDLHVQLPDGEEIYFYTPCRGEYNLPPYVYLDVDRRDADGPEVMSFKSFLPGTYTVFVHNYSQAMDSNAVDLKDSNAEVLIYAVGGATLLRRYKVPASGNGDTWDVCKFDGADFDGTDKTSRAHLKQIQKLTNRPNPETDYQFDCRPK